MTHRRPRRQGFPPRVVGPPPPPLPPPPGPPPRSPEAARPVEGPVESFSLADEVFHQGGPSAAAVRLASVLQARRLFWASPADNLAGVSGLLVTSISDKYAVFPVTIAFTAWHAPTHAGLAAYARQLRERAAAGNLSPGNEHVGASAAIAGAVFADTTRGSEYAFVQFLDRSRAFVTPSRIVSSAPLDGHHTYSQVAPDYVLVRPTQFGEAIAAEPMFEAMFEALVDVYRAPFKGTVDALVRAAQHQQDLFLAENMKGRLP